MSNKKEYEVLNPIAHGGRIERGDTVMLTDKEADNLGKGYVREAGKAPVEEEVQEDIELEDMTKEQLVAKAEELELSKSGSKSELIERIQLHEESSDEEEEDNEEEDEESSDEE